MIDRLRISTARRSCLDSAGPRVAIAALASASALALAMPAWADAAKQPDGRAQQQAGAAATAAQPAPSTATSSAASTATTRPPACVSSTPGRDKLELACPLAPDTTHRLRLRVMFEGSHDDTTASLVLSLDGKPVACDPADKTQTEGEDGDVALVCRFTAASKASPQALKASIAWYHARYVAFQLHVADRDGGFPP